MALCIAVWQFECLLRCLSTPDSQTRSRSHFSDCRSKIEADQEAASQPEIVASSFSFCLLFWAIFSRAAAQLPLPGQVQRAASLQFVQHPLPVSLSLSSSLCLCRTLHNCRLLIDRSNNVMDAQPAFDATTRGNPRCSSTRMYMYVRVSRHGY